jgi:hypothetical protein
VSLQSEIDARWTRIKARVEARSAQIASSFDSIWLPRVAEFGAWCFEHPRATGLIMLGCAAGGALVGYVAGRLG